MLNHKISERSLKHSRRRIALTVLALPALAGLLAAAAPAHAAAAPAPANTTATAGVITNTSGLSPQVAAMVKGTGLAAREQALAAYWTPARMSSARSADAVAIQPAAARAALAQAHPDGPTVRVSGRAPSVAAIGIPAGIRPLTGPVGSRWTGNFNGAPATTTGKVFFSDHFGGSWVCSAGTVQSGGNDAVFTAGHCVYGTIGGQIPGETWHTNWTYIPDFYEGFEPYGAWSACTLGTMTSYANTEDSQDDIGVAAMCTNNGQHILNVVGGQGIEWNAQPNQDVYDFGYPAQYPFDGQSLQECDGYEFNSPYESSTSGLACNFTGGSSGGPWLAEFNGTGGYVTGVNSFTVNGVPGEIFTPYFSSKNAGTLYSLVANL